MKLKQAIKEAKEQEYPLNYERVLIQAAELLLRVHADYDNGEDADLQLMTEMDDLIVEEDDE